MLITESHLREIIRVILREREEKEELDEADDEEDEEQADEEKEVPRVVNEIGFEFRLHC